LLDYAPPLLPRNGVLLRELLWLTLPVLAENLLHMYVGINDTWLAGHLTTGARAATAAVGTVTYVLWLMYLVASAIGTGSTALIARATGAKHRSLANSVCGQSVGAAALTGLVIASILIGFAKPLSALTGLSGEAHGFVLYYIRILCLTLPFNMVMTAANACLRGAGDTVTPAVSMIVVDVVNMGLSAALTWGWLGLPAMGFRGIAIGTVVAYVCGGVLQFGVLLHGRRALRLHLHRLRPHWLTLKRVLRIGLPSGMEGLLTWAAQFTVLTIINRTDRSASGTNLMASAHIVTIRVESLSFMAGMAVSIAAATLVGKSLGMRNPARATRSAYLAFALGAAFMGCLAIVFWTEGRHLAGFITRDAQTADLAARCLFVTAFAQIAFASSMIFGGALRGAGDTLVVMIINLSSTIGLRLTGVVFVTYYLHLGLVAIWVVLASELTIRGVAMYLRFLQGGWKSVKV
jgi:putative MATE family efflux protein